MDGPTAVRASLGTYRRASSKWARSQRYLGVDPGIGREVDERPVEEQLRLELEVLGQVATPAAAMQHLASDESGSWTA